MIEMKKQGLSEKDKREICDTVGKFLVEEIYDEKIRAKAKKIVSDIVKKNKLDVDSSDLFDAMEFHVQVLLKK